MGQGGSDLESSGKRGTAMDVGFEREKDSPGKGALARKSLLKFRVLRSGSGELDGGSL